MGSKLMIPMSCKGVKCMIKGCRNLSAHKVGEENIWCNLDYPGNDEKQKHEEFNQRHHSTTYLCEEHFTFVMNRETEYNTIPDDRFKDRKAESENPKFRKGDKLRCLNDSGDRNGQIIRFELEVGQCYIAAFNSFFEDDDIEYVELEYNHAGEPCCQYKADMFEKAD